MLAGLRDANPVVSLGQDTLESLAADDPEDVKAGVRNHLGEVNVAADFYDTLDEEVAELLEDAARRAEANDRTTLQPRDL